MTPSPAETPLDPQAAVALRRVRRLMLVSVLFTGIAIAAVLAVIGYRVSRDEGSRPPVPQVQAALPAGAKVLATAVAGDRIVVTLEVAGRAELRLFDLQTLQPRGRLELAPAP